MSPSFLLGAEQVSALAARTLAELTSRAPAVLGEAVSRAAAFFEHATGHPRPADPAVTADPASPGELAALRDALIGLVNDPPTRDLLGHALFALGKSADRSLVPFLVRWLVDHRHEDAFATHQALVGLNNHGEPTLSLAGGLSATDPDLTRRQADHYLREIGAV